MLEFLNVPVNQTLCNSAFWRLFRSCSCNPAGQSKSEVGRTSLCNQVSGKCSCKEYVEGQECDKLVFRTDRKRNRYRNALKANVRDLKIPTSISNLCFRSHGCNAITTRRNTYVYIR